MAFGQSIEQRKLNKRNHVVDIFREYGPLSKARVRQLSGYSMDTLIGIFKGLEEEGYVRLVEAGEAVEPSPAPVSCVEEPGEAPGTETGEEGQRDRRARVKGRPAELYRLDDERELYLGTTFNQSGIYSVIVGLSGKVLASSTEELQDIADQGGFEAAFVRHLLAFLSANSLRIPRIRRVGLALPGQHDAERGILFHYNLMPFLRDLDLGAVVRRHLADVPLTCRHNVAGLARCVLGERELVACHERILYVSARAGAAHALIQDGRLLLDNGEMGHIKVSGSEARCDCGRSGCLDTLFSARHFRSLLKGRSLEAIAAELRAEESRGEAKLRALIEPGFLAFAEALLDLCAAFSPDLLVLSGELLSLLPDPPAWIRAWIGGLLDLDRPPPWFPRDLVYRRMGSEAAAIGLCLALMAEDWAWQGD